VRLKKFHALLQQTRTVLLLQTYHTRLDHFNENKSKTENVFT